MKTYSIDLKQRLTVSVRLVILALLIPLLAGCYQIGPTPISPTATAIRVPNPRPANTIVIDGSAIVARLMHGEALGFQTFLSGYTVQIGEAGTRDGFASFCADRTDIQDAVRSILPQEASDCLRRGVNYLEIVIGYDALAVIGDAPVGGCISATELTYVYTHPNLKWSEMRSGLPADPVRVFAPPPETADAQFFAEQVITTQRAVRAANIQDLITAGGGLGYLSLPAARKLNGRLAILAVDSGGGCTEPTESNIWDGSYSFLSRPLYIYVNRQSVRRSEVFRFLTFALSNLGQQRIAEAGFIVAPAKSYTDVQAEIDTLYRQSP